jgi:hypothetical protein
VLLALLLPATSRAEEEAPKPRRGEVLDDDFDPLELFGRISELRPRLRVVEEFAIDQPFAGAEVDTYTTRLRASVAAPLSRSFALRVSGRFAVSAFDFRGDSGFLDGGRTPADPFDSLYSNSFRLEGRYSLRDDWVLLGGSELSSSWEAGSRYRDGLQGQGFFGVGHIFWERFSVVAGMRVGSKLGRSGATLGPLVQVGWRVTDRLEIETEGLGLKIAYRTLPSLTVFVSGSWESSSYRLEDRGGTLDKAILRDRRAPAQVGLSWKIAKCWRARGSVGAIAYQKYTVVDEDRDSSSDAASTGAAFAGQLELEFRF